jgi:hypothetical protein
MIGKWMLWAAAPMLLCGCAAPEPGEPFLLVHGGAEAAGTTPAWCYSTLADADCYLEREPDAGDRLIGAYLPAEPHAHPE